MTRQRQVMRGMGVRFLPIYGRPAFQVGSRFRFWGGLRSRSRAAGPAG